jgi:hypothetical protein
VTPGEKGPYYIYIEMSANPSHRRNGANHSSAENGEERKICDAHSEEESSEPSDDRKWGSKAELLIVMVGHSMGTSDMWRFPYLVLRNGGGKVI